MAISIPSGTKKFRPAVIPLFVFFVVSIMLVAFLLIGIKHGFHFYLRPLAIVAGCVVIYSLGASWMLSALNSAGFSADGIYGHSVWGRRRFVRWQDIAMARTFRFFNLRWIRLHAATNKKVTWLPLFQTQKADFYLEIRRLAPPDSPVLRCLQ